MVLAEEYNGVQVVRVEPGSPAFKCKDLQQGNILVSLSPPPPPRTNRTRRVPHPVLSGHAASLTPY